MNVFFDVDYTILGIDGSLRPGTAEVFQKLVEDGHDVYVWSGVGVRWGEVRAAGLEPFVRGVYQKPLFDFDAGLGRYGVPVVPDFVVDDYPGIVHHFGGVCIKPYVTRARPDDELAAIPDLLAAYERELRVQGLLADEPGSDAGGGSPLLAADGCGGLPA
ncbi:MAG TPA: hypothetical protein VKV36_07295 [Acidimicrobiales bacterium]|nr:hypothetical protein [Acidimicrobiales bacterium]